MPRGLRVFSVYALLQRDPVRDIFTRLFLDMVAALDMQIPTLMMGDFNGTISPDRDYHAGEALSVLCSLDYWVLVARF